jgi:hypothetical protein
VVSSIGVREVAPDRRPLYGLSALVATASAVGLAIGCFDFASVGSDADASTGAASDAGADANGCQPAPEAGRCRLFHRDCPQPAGCYVDPGGSGADASDLHCANLGANGNGAPCSGPDDCSENLACLGGPDGGLCTWWCIVPGESPPFDTCGIDRTIAGQGGCPPGYSCKHVYILEAWIGECTVGP